MALRKCGSEAEADRMHRGARPPARPADPPVGAAASRVRSRRSAGLLAVVGACVLLVACSAISGASPTQSGSDTAARAVRATLATADPPAPALAAGQQGTVTYCNHEQAQITEPAVLHGSAPAVVYVHGGAWVSGNDDSGGFLIDAIGPALASAGFVVVSLDYRLGPAAQWPDQIEDVTCAVRYLRANAQQLHISPNAIGAWGVSAGGHLVSLLGTAGPEAGWDGGPYAGFSSSVESVVDLAGPSDLLTMGGQGDAPLVAKEFVGLLGTVPAKDLGSALAAASPDTYVRHGDPPFLILQSTNDTVVYPQQSLELSWDLAANGVPHQLVMVQGGGHGFDDPGASPDQAQITSLIVRYFVHTLVLHSTTGLVDGGAAT